MDPSVQILDPMIEVRGVGPPHQPIHAGGGLPLESEERRPQHLRAEMVEERGEPFLPSVPCGLPYALQRLGHACPVLRPARALLARIPLGRRPSSPCRPRCCIGPGGRRPSPPPDLDQAGPGLYRTLRGMAVADEA